LLPPFATWTVIGNRRGEERNDRQRQQPLKVDANNAWRTAARLVLANHALMRPTVATKVPSQLFRSGG